jgi:hypothetical protein
MKYIKMESIYDNCDIFKNINVYLAKQMKINILYEWFDKNKVKYHLK